MTADQLPQSEPRYEYRVKHDHGVTGRVDTLKEAEDLEAVVSTGLRPRIQRRRVATWEDVPNV